MPSPWTVRGLGGGGLPCTEPCGQGQQKRSCPMFSGRTAFPCCQLALPVDQTETLQLSGKIQDILGRFGAGARGGVNSAQTFLLGESQEFGSQTPVPAPQEESASFKVICDGGSQLGFQKPGLGSSPRGGGAFARWPGGSCTGRAWLPPWLRAPEEGISTRGLSLQGGISGPFSGFIPEAGLHSHFPAGTCLLAPNQRGSPSPARWAPARRACQGHS